MKLPVEASGDSDNSNDSESDNRKKYVISANNQFGIFLFYILVKAQDMSVCIWFVHC